MNGLLKQLRTPAKATLLLIIFYSVGIVGMAITSTRPLFIRLIPFALLLSAFLLIVNHKGKFTSTHLRVYFLIFLAGFLLEMLGIHTGWIFGDYTYGSGLGFKIAETPLMIGLNWLMLVYVTASVFQSLKWNAVGVILGGATLMVIYDSIMEQIAPGMDMWSWSGDIIPLKNYLTWWLVAAAMHTLLAVTGIRIKNPLAPAVFAIQFLFFIILYFVM